MKCRNTYPAFQRTLFTMPGFWGGLPLSSSRKSCERTTFLPSVPGMSPSMHSPPTATITTSGAHFFTNSAVTFLLQRMSMFGYLGSTAL